MRTLRLAVIALAVAGCSSDPEESNSEKLRGKWGVELNSACIAALVLNDGEYEADIICELESGTLGIEGEAGSYGASEDSIDFVPELASCFMPDRDYAPYTLKYSVNDDVLRLVQPSGLMALEKITDDPEDLGSSGGIAEYGCLEAGTFYPGEVAPVN